MIPGFAHAKTITPAFRLKKALPEKALVIYYSQTGHTRIYGELIAATMQKAGLDANAVFIKKAPKANLADYDLIIVGTPVHYLEMPLNVQTWLESISPINGTGVASYATFGGNGDGQEKTAANVLKLLSDKGGAALGMATFGNMSTYPPTWSMGNSERILKFKDRPNEKTYQAVRAFSEKLITQYKIGPAAFETESSSIMGGKTMMSANKLIVSHHLNKKKCIVCGACMRQCPSGAIDLAQGKIDNKKCLLCFGCLNNCPAGAHEMKMLGKTLYGFPEFLKKNNIKIALP